MKELYNDLKLVDIQWQEINGENVPVHVFKEEVIVENIEYVDVPKTITIPTPFAKVVAYGVAFGALVVGFLYAIPPFLVWASGQLSMLNESFSMMVVALGSFTWNVLQSLFFFLVLLCSITALVYGVKRLLSGRVNKVVDTVLPDSQPSEATNMIISHNHYYNVNKQNDESGKSL